MNLFPKINHVAILYVSGYFIKMQALMQHQLHVSLSNTRFALHLHDFYMSDEVHPLFSC